MVLVWAGATALLLRLFGRRRWATLPPRLRIDLSLAWALVSLGALQVLFTPLRFASFDEGALWFSTSGGAIVLTGALNLLHLARRPVEAAIGRLCLAANLWLSFVFVAVATHRGAEPPHDPMSVAMIAVALGAAERAWAARPTAAA